MVFAKKKFRKIFIINIFLVFILPLFSEEVSQRYTPESLYVSALGNNFQLQLLNIDKKKAEIDVKNAKANMFPSIDFQTTFSYIVNPLTDPISLTAGELGSYTVAGEDILLPMADMVLFDGIENTNYNFNFIIDQPIFTWGKIKNAIDLYEIIVDAKNFTIENNKKEIKTKINIYFHTLFYVLKIEEKLLEQKEYSNRLIKIAEEAYNNGLLLYADLLKAKINAKKIDIAQAELKEQKSQIILEISHISGIENLKADSFKFSYIKPIDKIIIYKPEIYLEEAIKTNPGMLALKSLQEINKLRVKISKGSFYLKPDIGLHLELGYGGPRFPFIESDWYGKDSISFSSTIALKANIWDGGKIDADIKKNIEELSSAVFQYKDGVNNLDKFISETILKIELNRKNVEYYQLKQENVQLQIEQKETTFKAGAGSEKDYINEKINLNNELIGEYQELIDFYKNYFSLKSVTS